MKKSDTKTKSAQSETAAPTIRDWAMLTGSEFAALDKTRCVVFVTCSPLEVHGPHLPVVADNLESESLFARALSKLAPRHPEITFLRLPPLFVATDVVPQVGSIAFRIETIVDVLRDLGHSLCRQGFRDIWVGNFHGGPRHFLAIEQAAHDVNRRHDARMLSAFSMLARKLTNGTSDAMELLAHIDGLSKSVLKGDNHGGVIETSMLLHLLGEEHLGPGWRELPTRTVDAYRREHGERVPDAPVSKRGIIGIIKSYVASMKFYETETYAGSPAAASPEIGERVIDFLAEHAAEMLSLQLEGKVSEAETHSPLWPLRHIALNPTFNRALAWLVNHKSQVI